MQITLSFDDDFMNKIKRDSGIETSVKVITEAIFMFRWMLKESKKGRILFSASQTGEDIKKVVTPAFIRARQAGEEDGILST